MSAQKKCRYNRGCTRADCTYSHPKGRNIDKRKKNQSWAKCYYGVGCVDRACGMSHPEERAALLLAEEGAPRVVQRVMVAMKGGRSALKGRARRFALERAPPPGCDADRILGVAVVPSSIVAELRARFKLDPRTGALVEEQTSSEVSEAQPAATALTNSSVILEQRETSSDVSEVQPAATALIDSSASLEQPETMSDVSEAQPATKRLLRGALRSSGPLWRQGTDDPASCCPLGLGRTRPDDCGRCALANRGDALAAFVEGCEIFGFDPAAEKGEPLCEWRADVPLGAQTAAFILSSSLMLEEDQHLLMVVEGIQLLEFHFHGADLNFVSGTREESDLNAAEAAAREVGEEAGLRIDATSLEPLGEPYARISYSPKIPTTRRPKRERLTQAFLLNLGTDNAADDDALLFRDRLDFRGDLDAQETAERARIASSACPIPTLQHPC